MERLMRKSDFISFFDLSRANDEELMEISRTLGLALNLEEMKAIRSHFKRWITDVELQTFGQTWSEHCFHKTFKGTIEINGRRIDNILKTYIAKATKELNKSWCFSVFEDNAGLIEFNDEYLIAAKVETHNHPSAVEPFGGAATGIGGVIRDILGVWGEPIALTDVLCFGPLNINDVPYGIKHPLYIYRGVIAGIGHYGNNMGIPTVAGSIIFDEGYIGNPIVYCGCIGILHKSHYIKGTRAGDYAILIGGRTGRDGIHGVTFASTELPEESDKLRSAVQIPNPFMEEKLRRAIIAIRNERLASGITDLGGGGISCAIGETAHKHNLGVEVILENVHLKEPNMAPWEIWISESQERMLITVPKENLKRTLQVLEEEDVEYSILGIFDESKILRVKYKGILVCEIDLDFLFNPPKVIRRAIDVKYEDSNYNPPEPRDLCDELLSLLSDPNIKSKEEVIRTYDHEVRGCTAIKPLQGDYGGPNDAAVIKPLKDSWMGIVISCGINPFYPDPYWMAAASIEEAIRNNICIGGRRIALLDNFVWGSPEKEDRMGSLLKAVEACYDFSKALDAPFISGKDSLYNESPLGPIRPTLLITGVGIIPDVRKAITSNLKSKGNAIYIIGITKNELAGSAYFRGKKINGGICPKVNAELSRSIMNRLIKAIDEEIIAACHDVSEGGIGVAAAEMLIASEFGMIIDLRKVPSDLNRSDLILFSESQSRFLVEVKKGFEGKFENIFQGIPHSRIGIVEGKSLKIIDLKGNILEINQGEIRRAWR
ncbi:MAG: phosphoribosylformylglycinamidine synthase subunit PurL [Candidatus Methanomethyliaceae archaeon]|nr:phosphoribosylformylglycinamidine synthase subunit PurL [Candidatus Methanomethyliaceae archaeon]MDW7971337.1 phosphoribosylformylglycinamidine synthase subunit PurL [Nitrososphaerota archaeon]